MFKAIASHIVCRATGAALSLAAGSFPRSVRVECTNACNASCIICPRQHMKRPVSIMEESLYKRIIEECGKNRCREVQLHHFGEPLLDRNLESRIRLAKEAGIGKVRLFSNGSLLTEEKSRGLLEAGLDEITVSFDGETPDEYERIRTPLKFDQTTENIKTLIRLRDAMHSPLRVRIGCSSTSDTASTQSLLPQEGIDKFSFGKTHNWALGSGLSFPKIRKACSRVWNTFTILASGEVALCCLDYDGRVILGDLNSGQTIREIFHGDSYRRIRRLHIGAGQYKCELCAACDKSFI